MLEIKDASISFGEDVLFSGFNMKLEKGEMACIAGRSGSGKTSLLNAVMGFIPLRDGKIIVDGMELDKTTVDAIRRSIAWIPQELALPSEWVSEMARLPFLLKANRKVKFSTEALFAHFAELGLDEELYGKRVVEVSGGQRQRIMLAIAAMLDKPLIVIDEPTSALDGASMDLVLTFFRRRVKAGAAVLAVSHDATFGAGCDKLIHL